MLLQPETIKLGFSVIGFSYQCLLSVADCRLCTSSTAMFVVNVL